MELIFLKNNIPVDIVRLRLTMVTILNLVSALILGAAFADETLVDSHAPFAVVELFTSEGCSSCPPADNIFSQIVAWAGQNNLNVLTLGFHVDYWNNLGWIDRFSDKLYTQRQQDYANAFGSSSVYTPQVIINGTKALVGSQKQLIVENIEKMLHKPAAYTINLKLIHQKSNSIEFNYVLSPEASGKFLNTAVIEHNLSSQVTRGENAGATLKHQNVVRYFKSIVLKKNEATMSLSLNPAWKIKDCSIIIYLQDPETNEILGAGQISLNLP